jgi:hypothetical protein
MSSGHILMATFLSKAMREAGLDVGRVAYELNYQVPHIPQSWLDGRQLPVLDRLKRLADVVKVDARALAIGRMIEEQPSLEVELRSLLDAVGLSFPSHDDTDLVSLPKRRAAVGAPPKWSFGPPPRP